ncbi:MAG: hypothetical protein H5T74_07600 [Actinobacteria bacterium]|nr:hypothetical protein [Actinomycetota bacterium]MDI6829973.1 hypothetical protein [Actinomycetota bacterium]
MKMKDKGIRLDDFFWCDELHVLREIRDGETLELKGFKAYCGKMRKDIDDSFCHRCFLH